MDLSTFRPGDWLIVAGGAVMMIFGLVLKWASFGNIKQYNAFDYFLTGGIAWLLLVVAAVIALVLGAGLLNPRPVRSSLIQLILTGIATALMLLRLILGAGDTQLGELDRGQGMYIAFLAAAVALGGAISNYREDREPEE